jgi:hypothetical protein
MNQIFKLLLLMLFLFKCNILFCQWETRSISLPLVKSQNEELKMILDSIFYKEQKCDYYSDTLLLGISIRVNPGDNKMFSVQFETETRKSVMFKTGSLGALSYFKHKDHICLVYFNMPCALFRYTDSVTTFHYQYYNQPNPNKSTSEDLLIVDYEDDSFSQWVYYFYDNHFHFDKYNNYCDK